MRLSHLICSAVFAGCFVAVTACTEPVEPQPDPEAAAEIGDVRRLPATLPAPSAETPRYVGLWATTAEGCVEPAWRFEQNGISTRGEVACEFQNVAVTDRGYDIQATCTAESPPTPYTIQLSFAESARAMMVAGGPWQAGAALVYCGALSTN